MFSDSKMVSKRQKEPEVTGSFTNSIPTLSGREVRAFGIGNDGPWMAAEECSGLGDRPSIMPLVHTMW